MEKPLINKHGDDTSISFYTLDNNVEEKVREEIEKLFEKKQKTDMKEIVYTCVKELMVNASKTNLKKTFFIEAKIDENDKARYDVAKKKVKKLMTDEYFTYSRSKLKRHDNNVKVKLEDHGNGILISVQNPTPIHAEEEAKIRKALKTAMNSESPELALYFSDDCEDSEGASLGLILIVNLLRETGLNPDLFRIGMIDGSTVARIEIPFNADYKSTRKKSKAHRLHDSA